MITPGNLRSLSLCIKNNMEFSKKELNILTDRDFLITKTELVGKVQNLFEKVRCSIFDAVQTSEFCFDEHIDVEYGKIFKGEDYKSLPYVVLDFPKFFSNKDIFAFRTMLWWGNFFSATLHLQGKSFIKHKEIIISNLNEFFEDSIYICVNDTPWEYDYSKNNYIPLAGYDINKIYDLDFIKISKKFDLGDYSILPELASSYFQKCLGLLIAKK